jgi:CMP-N-acetylneuraminic acid synthetase
MIYSKKKILAIIPARIGSKGLKKKNLKKIGGKNLVEHSIIAAKNSKQISRIAISTDSLKIKKIALKENVWCEKLRPKKYATDKSTTYNAIKFVLDNINYEPDLIIEIHPTYVFRKSKTIDLAIKKLLNDKKSDSLISVQKIEDTSHSDFEIDLINNYIKYKKSPISFNRHLLKKKYKSLGYILISKLSSFIKKKSMIGNNCIGYVMKNNEEIIDINNQLDFQLATIVYLSNQKKVKKT